MTQARKEEKASKDLKKTESTRTLIQRIKAMKASKVIKSTGTVNSSKGEKLAHTKEANLEEPMTEELPVRPENEGNKNNVDKKLWNTIYYVD